jgi:DNA-binding transcriptional regulator YiaG
MAELTKKLLQEVKAWCEQQHGRQSELARRFRITPQSVSNWFAGTQELTGEQALALQLLLKKEAAKARAAGRKPARRRKDDQAAH